MEEKEKEPRGVTAVTGTGKKNQRGYVDSKLLSKLHNAPGNSGKSTKPRDWVDPFGPEKA